MNLEKAPEQGILYALYIDRMEFRRYDRTSLLQKDVEENLLELHLFDEEKEYRYIKTESGEIERVISDASDEYDSCYKEKVYTLEKYRPSIGQVEVVNYITYDDNDLIRIDNYRLKEVR